MWKKITLSIDYANFKHKKNTKIQTFKMWILEGHVTIFSFLSLSLFLANVVSSSSLIFNHVYVTLTRNVNISKLKYSLKTLNVSVNIKQSCKILLSTPLLNWKMLLFRRITQLLICECICNVNVISLQFYSWHVTQFRAI